METVSSGARAAMCSVRLAPCALQGVLHKPPQESPLQTTEVRASGHHCPPQGGCTLWMRCDLASRCWQVMGVLVADVSYWSWETGSRSVTGRNLQEQEGVISENTCEVEGRNGQTPSSLRNVTRSHLMLYRGTQNQNTWAGEDFLSVNLDQQAQHLLGMGKKCKRSGPTWTFRIRLCGWSHIWVCANPPGDSYTCKNSWTTGAPGWLSRSNVPSRLLI